MTGVIYARYSSDNQREESIEGQIRENTAYAQKNGIDIVGTYIDRAYSAKTDNRPEFQRMIKDSAKKGFDVVIVWKLDRFARNLHPRVLPVSKTSLFRDIFVCEVQPARKRRLAVDYHNFSVIAIVHSQGKHRYNVVKGHTADIRVQPL